MRNFAPHLYGPCKPTYNALFYYDIDLKIILNQYHDKKIIMDSDMCNVDDAFSQVCSYKFYDFAYTYNSICESIPLPEIDTRIVKGLQFSDGVIKIIT